MDDIEKYEKKLERAMRKRERQNEGEGKEDDEEEERERAKKIQKYEKKIQKARLALESQSKAAATATASALAGGDVVEIDKSGMTLLLFYAYVEPIWKHAEHAEVMRWAQSTLEGYGERSIS
jgi:hypothetical protein